MSLKPSNANLQPDFLIIGAGVAGLRAAIELAEAGQVLVVAKAGWKESSSEYAQGGIAAALSDDDEVELHEQDTLAAGDGLCNREAVHALVEEGPHVIEELIAWGAAFDREGSKLVFGQEGAHSRRRILHAHGDSTGREILRALWQKASAHPSVRVQSFTAITGLLKHDGAIAGAMAFDGWSGQMLEISARATLLATGGLGCVYAATTNPGVATGDGVALAWRAGAEISDIEFVQFHPTALKLEGAPCFLLSEALRGEGAYLRNAAGERFMSRYHALEELAPRDAVSRAMVEEMRRTGTPQVFLDLTHLDPDRVKSRFPRIHETCLHHGVDITRQAAPVHPAAHYAMGGVWTGLDGRSSLAGLFAAGECACTGVHGANRLASNSLLEGVVFGARAGRAMRELADEPHGKPHPVENALFPRIGEAELRRLAWEKIGLVRDEEGLRHAIGRLDQTERTPLETASKELYELRNMSEVARLIAGCALARKESRGGHWRSDYPEKREEFRKHSRVRRNGSVEFKD